MNILPSIADIPLLVEGAVLGFILERMYRALKGGPYERWRRRRLFRGLGTKRK